MKLIMNKLNFKLFIVLFLLIGMPLSYGFMKFNQVERVSAASFTALSDTLSRIKTGTLSSHTITFTTTHDIVTNNTVTVDFHEDDSGFVVAGSTTVVTDLDYVVDGQPANMVGVDGDCTGHAGATDVVASVADATGILTLKHCGDWVYAYDNDIVNRAYAADRVISIEYGAVATTGGAGVDRVTNPSPGAPPQSYTIDVAGSWGDAGKIGVVIIAEDQVGVTATVDPTISFSISDVAVGFGTFVGTAIRYATADATGSASAQGNGLPITLTASTNGFNGLIISISDEGNGTDAGLWSAAPVSELIAAAASTGVTIGSKKYGAYGKNASSLTIDPGFDNNGPGDLALARTSQSFATASGPVSSATVDLAFIAAIDATTKAGAYVDTVTVICTGRY